jgi:RNA polymerase sigma factor (sigma-70 family)
MDADLELLRAWQHGNEAAGNRLFDKYFPSVHRFFLHKATRESAADLVQGTFLACVRSAAHFEERSSFRSFLFGIARKELLSFWRSRDRERFDPMSSTLEGLSPSPGTLLEMKSEARMLLMALRSLPLDMQTLLELFYWERVPGPELAAIMEVPEGTIRSRLRLAREQLAERLSQNGSASSETTASNLDDWAAALQRALDSEP